jgi:hypothetical protein
MTHRHVMAGLVPAIRRGTVLAAMAGTSSAMTIEATKHTGRRHWDLASVGTTLDCKSWRRWFDRSWLALAHCVSTLWFAL